ncbi:C4-dicarboxylate transporter/malic acid transport protein [Streptomyces bingchenggensis BCW-1]|uniref:C4-dicarboxylate transporter/malic acid transport protein n=1 Tax=Streptomyces bingchenggensis (strain BCW-1) TaxID=749414 RepID=D7C2C6_STRBB|nr:MULTISPECIES: TDT family transporter [Streptomyces]ADI03780.1 C4-dicarboxylate transporter/malic acid transport protein [Streptomyces bingchenggensis BCW-1]
MPPIPDTAAPGVSAATRPRLPFGLLRDLRHPAQIFEHLGPNWYASVMGTGIVANAAVTLPVHVTGLRPAATLVWLLAAALLVALTAAWAVHWRRHPTRARAHADHPVTAHFWGAPAMALMTVGAGTLTLGRHWIGLPTALAVDTVLWLSGTVLGLVTSVWIPYRAMTRHSVAPDGAFGGWLMPVVPPMVSAANGALLVPYAAAGQLRLTLVLACYAMFGISVFAALIITVQIWSRLVHHTSQPAALVPTVWIVLGPLGQSVTAANALGSVAPLALPRPYATGAEVFGLLYGLPAWGFAMMWLALAAALTARTVRAGLPFSLTWWSFTFPVGTCVTGTSALAMRTGSAALQGASAVLYVFLVVSWCTVAVRTVRGCARGGLFLPPPLTAST